MSQVSVMPLQRQVSPTMAVIPAILVKAELLGVIYSLLTPSHRSIHQLSQRKGHRPALQDSEDIHRQAQGVGVLFVFNGD